MPVSKKEISPCPVDAALSLIDGRWKASLLWKLCDGPKRTSELRRSIPDMTERMLIRHLHELVESGILERHDQRTLPPCVRYSISPYGMTLVPVIQALCDWGRVHLARLRKGSRAGSVAVSKGSAALAGRNAVTIVTNPSSR